MTDEESVAAMTAQLLDEFRAKGVRMAGDLSVPESVFEAVLGLARGTLSQRYGRGTLTYAYRPEGNRRWYRVETLARALVSRGER